MSHIRVTIDASPLLLRSAGVKTYVHYWTRSLIASSGKNQVTLFPYLNRGGRFTHERSILGPVGTLARLALLHAARRMPPPALECLTAGCDIFHASHLIHRAPRNARLTTTLYDMTCWLMPETHPPSRVEAAGRIAGRLFRAAAAIIAISESARADALRLLDLSPDKITTIYPGVSAAFFEAAVTRAAAKPYVLFVGTVEPRKNLSVLLDAWERLHPDLRAAFDLVIAGAWGWGDRSILDRLHAGAAGMRYLGYVAESDLPGLTAGAAAFVYPSLYEGFGLPLAQAMAAGVPSITSNLSSLPEVSGGAALLVDPHSPAELRAALERLLESESLRRELGQRARARAKRFTWEECARRSWELFERVAG